MVDYSMAWMIVAGAGLLALAFWFLITRGIANRFVRTWLRCLAAVFMLAPAPVPGYTGQYAPAYVVALFEAVFQDAGEPQQAFIILAGGAACVTVLVVVWSLLRAKSAKRRDGPASDQASATAR